MIFTVKGKNTDLDLGMQYRLVCQVNTGDPSINAQFQITTKTAIPQFEPNGTTVTLSELALLLEPKS